MTDQITNDNSEIFLDLSFSIDIASVTKQIKMRAVDTDVEPVASALIDLVKPVARPKAVYRPLVVKCLKDSSFQIDNTTFNSRVLGKVLEEGGTVFPYIVTIGPELDALNLSELDMLGRYRLDTVKSMVLMAAGRTFEEYLREKYPSRRLTHINPGELDDWPLPQQKLLFSLFEGVTEKLGVRLTDGCMIKPVKSRAGIYFANDDGFETCRLCKQFRCPGRRAAFDAATVAKYTS
jgi:hypothetical protein